MIKTNEPVGRKPTPQPKLKLAGRLSSIFSRLLAQFLLLVVAPLAVFGQQPTPAPSPTATPERTGRSYTAPALPKTPPPAGPQAISPVTFTNVTTQAGIGFRHAPSATPRKYLLETMGGGVAILDYDNDGRMDLFFTNGALLKDPMPKEVMPDKTDPKYWNRLYHHKPDGTFEDVTERAGLKGDGYSMGVAAGDYDNDGYPDIYLTGYGENHLYRNNGAGTFMDVTKKLGVSAGGWSTSAAWLDYDNDGHLDLFMTRYLDWDFEKGSLHCGDARPESRAYCHPDNFKGATNILYHQKPDGAFEDVSVKSGVADPDGKGLGVALADFDNDGWIDVFVANDSVRQFLYHNKGNATFEDVTLMSGAAYDEDGKTFAGMGVDAADYDNDGYPDVFITTLSYQTYPLYHNNGDLSFTYTTKPSGVGQITLLNSGWGTRFIDADNDGLRDVFVAQSHVLDTIEESTGYLKYKQNPLLMRNTGKGFVNVSVSSGPAFNIPVAARGAAFGDLNNDGQLDAVISVLGGPPVVLRSNGTRNHWVGVSLVGAKSNRSGIGARVTITDAAGKKQIFDANTAGSYLSSNDPRILFGLGAATGVRSIQVKWPSGRVQHLADPGIDRYIVINERDAK